jgi:hypothetical protein
MFFLAAGDPSPATATQSGESIEAPKIITLGFDAYKFGGPVAAIKAWVKDGPLEGNRDALGQADTLRQAQASLGSFRSFELISGRTMSPSTRIVYMTLDYERGPVFAKFSIYRTDEGWIVTAFAFSTDEDQILPACQ